MDCSLKVALIFMFIVFGILLIPDIIGFIMYFSDSNGEPKDFSIRVVVCIIIVLAELTIPFGIGYLFGLYGCNYDSFSWNFFLEEKRSLKRTFKMPALVLASSKSFLCRMFSFSKRKYYGELQASYTLFYFLWFFYHHYIL